MFFLHQKRNRKVYYVTILLMIILLVGGGGKTGLVIVSITFFVFLPLVFYIGLKKNWALYLLISALFFVKPY